MFIYLNEDGYLPQTVIPINRNELLEKIKNMEDIKKSEKLEELFKVEENEKKVIDELNRINDNTFTNFKFFYSDLELQKLIKADRIKNIDLGDDLITLDEIQAYPGFVDSLRQEKLKEFTDQLEREKERKESELKEIEEEKYYYASFGSNIGEKVEKELNVKGIPYYNATDKNEDKIYIKISIQDKEVLKNIVKNITIDKNIER